MSSPPILVPGVWPPNLPEPDRDSYAYLVQMGMVRTAFQGGFKRQRRTQYGQPTTLTLTFRMDNEQVGTFQAFMETNANRDFKMELVLPSAWLQNIKRDCMQARVRFIGDPSVAQIAPNLYRVSVPAFIRSILDARWDPNEPTRRATVDDVQPEFWDTLTDTDNLTLPV